MSKLPQRAQRKIKKIWDKMKAYFVGEGVNFDFVLFSNYEQQVNALLAPPQVAAAEGPRPPESGFLASMVVFLFSK